MGRPRYGQGVGLGVLRISNGFLSKLNALVSDERCFILDVFFLAIATDTHISDVGIRCMFTLVTQEGNDYQEYVLVI